MKSRIVLEHVHVSRPKLAVKGPLALTIADVDIDIVITSLKKGIV